MVKGFLCIMVKASTSGRGKARASHIHYKVIRGRCMYWASDVEPQESSSSVGRG